MYTEGTWWKRSTNIVMTELPVRNLLIYQKHDSGGFLIGTLRLLEPDFFL